MYHWYTIGLYFVLWKTNRLRQQFLWPEGYSPKSRKILSSSEFLDSQDVHEKPTVRSKPCLLRVCAVFFKGWKPFKIVSQWHHYAEETDPSGGLSLRPPSLQDTMSLPQPSSGQSALASRGSKEQLGGAPIDSIATQGPTLCPSDGNQSSGPLPCKKHPKPFWPPSLTLISWPLRPTAWSRREPDFFPPTLHLRSSPQHLERGFCFLSPSLSWVPLKLFWFSAH